MRIDPAKLKALLVERKMKQWELAKRVDIHETNLSKIMTGRLDPSRDLVRRMCRVLRVSLSSIM